MNAAQRMYQYTESGLDDVYLVNGFEYVNRGGKKHVRIADLEGLHRAIGRYLLEKRLLSGRELRFLRHEILMSQKTLAELLGVGEQAINRWERDKSDIPGPALRLIRLLYLEHVKDGPSEIRETLQRIAAAEDDNRRATFRVNADAQWEAKEAA